MHDLIHKSMSSHYYNYTLFFFLPFIRTVDVKAGIKVVSHRLQMVRLMDGSLTKTLITISPRYMHVIFPYERKSRRLLIRFIVLL